MTVQFVIWFLFSVSIALLPVLGNLIWARVEGAVISLNLVCSHGELFLVSVAVGASALSEVFEAIIHNARRMTDVTVKVKILTTIFIGTSIVAILATGLYYGMVSVKLYTRAGFDESNVAQDSIWALCFVFLVGIGCLGTASRWVPSPQKKRGEEQR